MDYEWPHLSRAVIKKREPGIFLGYYEYVAAGLIHRKIEET